MDRTTKIKLRRFLAELYDDSREIRQLIADAGLAAARIDLSGSVENIWHDVLSEAEKSEKVEQLIETVYTDRPEKRFALDTILGRSSDNPATPVSASQVADQLEI